MAENPEITPISYRLRSRMEVVVPLRRMAVGELLDLQATLLLEVDNIVADVGVVEGEIKRKMGAQAMDMVPPVPTGESPGGSCA